MADERRTPEQDPAGDRDAVDARRERVIRDAIDADAGAPPTRIDLDDVVRRARRRRAPRQAVLVGVSGLAAAAAIVTGVAVAQPSLTVTGFSAANESADDADESGAESADAPSPMSDGRADQEDAVDPAAGGGISLAPAYKTFFCGGTLEGASPDPAAALTASARFPSSAAPGATVAGTVLLTNTSAEPVTGTLAAPGVTALAREGVVLWHTDRPSDTATPIELAPGESVEVPASLDTRVCSVDDDALPAFPPDLPPVDPGQLEVVALVEVILPDGLSLRIVTDPAAITVG